MSSPSVQNKGVTPTQFVVLSFAVAIGIGTCLLLLPISTAGRVPPGFLDALFTAASAVCVTGLTVVSTATFWSGWGKTIILLLIQAGGLGLMTLATAHALVTGRRVSLRERLLIQEQTGQWSLSGLVGLVKRIIVATLLLEAVGAVALSICFGLFLKLGLWESVCYGVFHSVSAFCNAGFDITGNSLIDYASHPGVILTVSFLIIAGGMGFSVISDLWANRGRLRKTSLHSQLSVKVTTVLLLAGAVSALVLESSNPGTIGNMTLKESILPAWFQSVTARTAGFNSVAVDRLLPSTAFFLMMLMFIGASPGGTGGGVKTTTFAVALRAVTTLVRGRQDVTIGKRRLPGDLVGKATAIVLISLLLVIVSTFVLTVTENASFLDVSFEVISAFGTVGLSRGITSSLTPAGKCIIIATMFAGRVGPLSLAIALSDRKATAGIRYPEERIFVG